MKRRPLRVRKSFRDWRRFRPYDVPRDLKEQGENPSIDSAPKVLSLGMLCIAAAAFAPTKLGVAAISNNYLLVNFEPLAIALACTIAGIVLLIIMLFLMALKPATPTQSSGHSAPIYAVIGTVIGLFIGPEYAPCGMFAGLAIWPWLDQVKFS